MDCGLAFPLSVNVKVPVRVVPLAEPVLVNLTVTVHDAPGAMIAPVQLSGPASVPTLKKYVRIDPPVAAMLDTVTFEPPTAAVLVKVTVPVPVMLVAPVGNVISSGLGRIVTAGAAPPVPVSVTVEPVTVVPVKATASVLW